MATDLPDWQREVAIGGGGVALYGVYASSNLTHTAGASPSLLHVDLPAIGTNPGDWISDSVWQAPRPGVYRFHYHFYDSDGLTGWYLSPTHIPIGAQLTMIPSVVSPAGEGAKMLEFLIQLLEGDQQSVRLVYTAGAPSIPYLYYADVEQVG